MRKLFLDSFWFFYLNEKSKKLKGHSIFDCDNGEFKQESDKLDLWKLDWCLLSWELASGSGLQLLSVSLRLFPGLFDG